MGIFKAILSINPKLDDAALRQLEKQLQSRFAKVAKGFGKGVANAFKGGGLLGVGLALVDKILNPLKETQEAIDRMLKSSDDIATNAKQFNTTSGRLFKLVQLAKGSGLDQDSLFTLISKYQGAVAEAKADPTKQTSVRQFVGKDDTAQGFFEFIQSLKKMSTDEQRLVQSEVFGEKQILKMSDFLQQDFKKLFSDIGLDKVSTEKLTNSIEKMGGLQDLTDVLSARRETKDTLAKGGIINEGMVRSKDVSERLALEKENKRIASYENLATLSQTADKISLLVETGVGMLGGLIKTVMPAINKLVATLEKLAQSPVMRGIKGLFGQGKDD